MPKIPECVGGASPSENRCQYFANSPYMVCGINPCGPTNSICEDFAINAKDHKTVARQPIGGGYYAGNWIPEPFHTLTTAEQLALLNWHPQFTGRCPNCEMPIVDRAKGQWHCEYCEWQESAI